MSDARLLQTFATPASAGSIVIEHIGEEFTSMCPVTGHPDFGTVTVRYEPVREGPAAGHGCVELKSLKLYFHSFRSEGIFYEAVTGKVRDDLVRLLAPVWLQVVTNWRGRGGIRSVVRAEHGPVPEQWRAR